MGFTQIYKHQLFYPNILSLFINPFLITRWFLVRKVRKFAPLLHGKVLDFGCGQKPYKSLFVNANQYIGVDYENEGHSHESEEVDFFYDGIRLPFESQEFDSIFSSEVFEHIFNYHRIFPEIHRVLKPNGSFLITVPFSGEEHEIPFDNCRFTTYGIKYLLELYDFEVIEIEKTGHFFAVISQYFISYIRELVFLKNKYLNLLLNFIFIFPFTIILLPILLIIPRKRSLYFNTIVLARKK